MKKVLIFFSIVFLFSSSFSQVPRQQNISPSELITFSLDTSFPVAIKALEVMAEKYEGRKIINTSIFTDAIGVPITELYWKEALRLIVNYNNLIIEELPGVYVVKDFIEEKAAEKIVVKEITPDTKQIRISSIFFTTDKSLARSLGIDWSTIIHGEVETSVDFLGGDEVVSDIFTAAGAITLETGKTIVELSSLLKTIESYQKGTIIARPSVTVISGKNGYLQVGKDISVRTKDYAGNLVDRFFSVGVILEVTPTIIEDSLKKAIHLVAKVERSDIAPGEVNIIVNKSQSSTDVLLFDGEETVIAGLYDNEYSIVRKGIPVLMDLPWWVFGLRYIFGYNENKKVEKEIVVVLKAEIIEPIEERMKKGIVVKENIEKMRNEKKHVQDIFSEKKEKDRKSSATEEVRPKGKVKKSKQAFSSEQEIYQHAKELYKSRRYAEAKEEFKKVLEKNADHKYAGRYIALCDKKMGKEVKKTKPGVIKPE